MYASPSMPEQIQVNANQPTSIIMAFLTVASLSIYNQGGFTYTLMAASYIVNGTMPFTDIVNGIELYTYHPNPTVHGRNITFVGGNLCIPTDNNEEPSKHSTCHASSARERDKKFKKSLCCS